MIKATYKGKHLTGGVLTVSEGEFMIVMMWSVVAGR